MPTNELRDENIGKRLKLRRLQLGLSEESLGLALGVTFEQVQKYESGNDPTASRSLACNRLPKS